MVRHHRLRIHTQAHVIESHGLHERDIVPRRPVLKMFLRVSTLVIDLREPFAGVDAMPQARHPRGEYGRPWLRR
jgi:hypothetical protein